jgi:CspA family cold shock protein
MPIGKVKKLVTDKGFGFIQPENGTDVFFHHSVVADRQFDDLTEGQKVEFTLDDGGGDRTKGPRAASVKPL